MNPFQDRTSALSADEVLQFSGNYIRFRGELVEKLPGLIRCEMQ